MLRRRALHLHEAPVVLPREGVVPRLGDVQFGGHVLGSELAVIPVKEEGYVGVPHAGNAHAAMTGGQDDAVCDERTRAGAEVVDGGGEEEALAHAGARWAAARAGVERHRRRAIKGKGVWVEVWKEVDFKFEKLGRLGCGQLLRGPVVSAATTSQRYPTVHAIAV